METIAGGMLVDEQPDGLIRRIRMLSDCCRRQESTVCRDLSLSASQFAGLMAFPEGEDVGVIRMAALLELSPSRASRIVDSLVRRGLLVREPAAKDRRREMLRLTKRGRDARRSIAAALRDCEQLLRRRLGAARAQRLERALTRLVEAF